MTHNQYLDEPVEVVSWITRIDILDGRRGRGDG